jgi:hypothetical protein
VQVGSILNFTIMFTLAPTAAASAGGNLIQKLMGDYYLKAWGVQGEWGVGRDGELRRGMGEGS